MVCCSHLRSGWNSSASIIWTKGNGEWSFHLDIFNVRKGGSQMWITWPPGSTSYPNLWSGQGSFNTGIQSSSNPKNLLQVNICLPASVNSPSTAPQNSGKEEPGVQGQTCYLFICTILLLSHWLLQQGCWSPSSLRTGNYYTLVIPILLKVRKANLRKIYRCFFAFYYRFYEWNRMNEWRMGRWLMGPLSLFINSVLVIGSVAPVHSGYMVLGTLQNTNQSPLCLCYFALLAK